MKTHISLLLAIFLITNIANGQVNFRKTLEEADPLYLDTVLTLEEGLIVHHEYLEKAKAENNTLKQLYGNLYIFYDHIKLEDFVASVKYILEAKSLAELSGNKDWQAWVTFRSGILYIKTDNVDQAINTFKLAVKLCNESGDKLCVGESYEQLCIMTGLAGNIEEAQQYFNLAIPILEQFGQPKNLCTAYSNYGSLLSIKGDPNEAILQFKKSIDYCGKINRFDAQASNMNNLADAYRRLKKFDKSINAYEQGVEFNTKHNYGNILIKNYMGLYLVHKEIGDYKKAMDYLIKRYELKDSLMGIDVQKKISTLELNFEKEKKELELEKSKTQLQLAKNHINLIWALLASLLSIGGLLIWFGYNKRELMKKQLAQNATNLRQLTQTLIRKNASLKSLEDRISAISDSLQTPQSDENIDESLFNQTILTSDDWSEFKVNYDKANPGYIQKLRKSFALTEAEERLFLLLKLKLTRNEIASILGVSPDTVKKTRNRLRKRLDLDRDDSLDRFAEQF